MTKKISRPRVLIVGLIVAVAVVAVVLFATQPWRMFTSSTIDEALPGTAVTTGAAPATAAAQTAQADAPAKTQQSPAQPVPAESAPVHLKQGSFSGIDHDTSGSAYLTELPDGRRIIRLENLATDDGPDLKIVVTTSDVDPAQMTDADYVGLGALKATHGNQNYDLPAEVDTDSVYTVVVWCERFRSAFGAARLA